MYPPFLLFLSLLPSVFCANRTYELELTNAFIQPDGFNRSAILVNQQFPGPIISAHKYDYLQINVVNKLTDTSMAQGTSIHWHGLFQHKTASQDGVSWITQCPISPGEIFPYSFNIGEQTGTYWYHSHITTQYCDGLRGPLIIYDHEDPLRDLYDVDDESTVITLGDWLHLPSPLGFVKVENPESTVINGLGRSAGGPKSPLAVVSVNLGARYRFRIINTACIAAFNFSIDHHKLTVIEVDGIETHPLQTDIVSIFAGQRVSVVVKADQPVDNYWIRAIPLVFEATPSNETGVDAAIFRYANAENVEPITNPTSQQLLREQDLVPLFRSDLSSKKPDHNITLNIGATGTSFTINDKLYTPPPIPVLLQIMNGSVDALSIMPRDAITILPRNKLISVTIPGGSPAAPHPFHLHGHNFEVVRSAGSDTYNFENPPVRDVVNTGMAGDNVTFLFRTDNPGPWFLHCHIDFHLEAGLALIFVEDPEGQISGPDAEETPENWEALCPKWSSLKTGKQYSVTDLE